MVVDVYCNCEWNESVGTIRVLSFDLISIMDAANLFVFEGGRELFNCNGRGHLPKLWLE